MSGVISPLPLYAFMAAYRYIFGSPYVYEEALVQICRLDHIHPNSFQFIVILDG